MILDSLITPVPGFACEPCGAGQSQVMRTADDVASKGRVDESQPELGRQDQSWLGTNAKKKKLKPGKRVQFQETGEIETGTELSGEIGNPEAKVSALCASYPTDQRKRDKERKQAGVEVKRKPQHVEQHFDDCGEDFTPLLYNQGESDEDTVEPDNCEATSDLDEQPDRMMSQYFGMAGSECTYGELHKIGALHHAVRVATNAAEFTKTWAHAKRTPQANKATTTWQNCVAAQVELSIFWYDEATNPVPTSIWYAATTCSRVRTDGISSNTWPTAGPQC